MKRSSLIALVFAGLVTACDPGEIFGPNTAVVSIEVTMEKMICDDVLRVTVNDEDMTPVLTLENPNELYRVRVQTREDSRGTLGSSQSSYVEYGTVHVGLWSTRRARLSTKSVSVHEDRVTLVKFHETDFGIPVSMAKPCGE